MSSLQPIKLHSHPGPNPWKIAILFEELGIPYTTKVYTTPELKKPDFLKINSNGMTPVIEDPNTGLVLAESGAIMDYLLDQYDTKDLISFTGLPEKYLAKQWLQFQTTIQGPVYQHIFHHAFVEPNPEARASYIKQFRHVLSVLEGELAEKQWLVGGKCSAADLSFVPFHSRMDLMVRDYRPDMEKEFPNVDRWFKQICEREHVKKVLEDHQVVLGNLNFPGKK